MDDMTGRSVTHYLEPFDVDSAFRILYLYKAIFAAALSLIPSGILFFTKG